LEEIVEGATDSYVATPMERVKEAKMLAWKVIEDERPLRVHYCILWIRLNNPNEWVLVNVARNRYSLQPWSPWSRIRQTYFTSDMANPFLFYPFWIKFFDHSPTTPEIETFLVANQWSSLEGFKLVDGEICTKAWKNVTGEEPQK
jgi:hypothetical protein